MISGKLLIESYESPYQPLISSSLETTYTYSTIRTVELIEEVYILKKWKDSVKQIPMEIRISIYVFCYFLNFLNNMTIYVIKKVELLIIYIHYSIILFYSLLCEMKNHKLYWSVVICKYVEHMINSA